MPAKFDIISENFDLYFAKEISKLNEYQKGQIPHELLFKLFKRMGVLNYKSSNKIGFVGKLLILSKSGKNIFIVVEDENGIGLDEFHELKKNLKHKRIEHEHGKVMSADGIFVTANKELVDTLSFMHDICSSPLYNYLTKVGNTPRNKVEIWKEQTAYIMKFITKYEGSKKKWMVENGINIQEFMILVALYGGQEIQSKTIIKETYKNSFYTGSMRMKTAFGTLQTKGLIAKNGVTKLAKMKITPLGSDMISDIMFKFAFN